MYKQCARGIKQKDPVVAEGGIQKSVNEKAFLT